MTERPFRRRMERLPRSVRRLVEIGESPSDSEELRVRKAVLVLSTALMASLALVWVATYAWLGLWVSAAIPFAYQVASAASLSAFSRTHRYARFRDSQLLMSLLLPFALQWSLGGFENASAVCLWGFTSPLGALLIAGARAGARWFAAFVVLVVASAAIDSTVAAGAPAIPDGLVITFFALNVLGVAATAYALLHYFVRERERAHAESERLLLNVLPGPVAKRLKAHDGIIADDCADVTVLLDRVFAAWDALVAEHGLEKIKTIGDAYMVAGGIPLPRPDHAEAIAELALAMGPRVASCAGETGVALEVRIGIDTGPVVAGVIGRAKFIYDLWGDTVNTASRMESHALPGTIQVTERTYERLRGGFELRRRGIVDIKGKGPMDCYELTGPRPPAASIAQPDAAVEAGRRVDVEHPDR